MVESRDRRYHFMFSDVQHEVETINQNLVIINQQLLYRSKN